MGCVGITLVFCFTGVGHFIKTEPMAEMLAPWVPWRIPLVYVSGIIEVAAALAVLFPRLRSLTGMALIVMLGAFLPVNIYAAVNYIGMGGHQWEPIYLLIRIPLQAILIGWIWWFAIRLATTAPIRFASAATVDLRPDEIADQILDLSKWQEFTGYGLLPGIKTAKLMRSAVVCGQIVKLGKR